MVRRFVLVGAALLTAGILASIFLSVQLSNVLQTHNSLCVGPVGVPQTPFCRSVENNIHVAQGLMYVGLVTAGAGVFLLALAASTRPRKPAPLPSRGYAVRP